MKIILSNSKMVFETTLPKKQVDFYNQGYINRDEPSGLITQLSPAPGNGWVSMPISIDDKTQIVIETITLSSAGFMISFYTKKPFDSFSEGVPAISEKLRNYGNPIVSTSIPGSGTVNNTAYSLADAKAAGAHYAIVSAYVMPESYVPKAYIQ